MDPINYSAMLPQDNFLQSIQGGLQLGHAIKQARQESDARDAAAAQAEQYSSDAQSAIANPTPQAFAALALKYPAQREAVKQSWDGLSAADQKSEGDTMSQAYAALLAGKPDVAKSVVQDQITARKNSGIDTSHFDSALQLLDTDPQKAQAALGFTLSHIGDPKDFAAKFGALQGEQRAEDLAPSTLRAADAKASEANADAAQKNLIIVGSTLGGLQGKNAKPSQVTTAIKSLAAKGLIAPDDVTHMLAEVPTDPAALDAWLGTAKLAGVKPEDQMKYTTPTADATLSSKTQIQTTGMNNRTQLEVQKHIDDRQEKDDPANATLTEVDEKIAKSIAAGKAPPMSSFAMLKPANKAIMARVLDINPNYDAGDYLAKNKALRDYSTGTQGLAVQAANTGLNHLQTIEELAKAQKNGNIRSFNAIANRLATETGGSAPTNLAAAITMVAPEVSKMVIGAAGGQEERATFAKNFNPNASPEQTIGGIGTIRKLLGGRLTEAERTYKRTTGRENFGSDMLSPAAQEVLNAEKPVAKKTAAIPAGWTFTVHP